MKDTLFENLYLRVLSKLPKQNIRQKVLCTSSFFHVSNHHFKQEVKCCIHTVKLSFMFIYKYKAFI